MAERRMFSKSICDSDKFLDMPGSTQLLYFHLGLHADDDGFVASPQKIMRTLGSSNDDFKLLRAKEFIIPFESGICVITHWKVNNYLRADRHKPTIHQREMALLSENSSSEYTLSGFENESFGIPISNQTPTIGIPDVNQKSTNCLPTGSIGKESIDKSSKEKHNTFSVYTSNVDLITSLESFIEFRKKIKKPMTDRAITLLLGKLDKLATSDEEKISILDQSVYEGWQGIFPLKQPNGSSQVGRTGQAAYTRGIVKPDNPIRTPEEEEWFNKHAYGRKITDA